MFLGEYQHTLDAKGRLSLPVKFRAGMTGSLVVAKGLGDCLYVYAADEYRAFIERLMAQDDFDPRFRQVRRFFTSGAIETELDSAGRITLPPVLRDYAGLVREVAVIGNGNRIELWDATKWAEYNGQTTERIEDVTKELAELGIL